MSFIKLANCNSTLTNVQFGGSEPFCRILEVSTESFRDCGLEHDPI